MGDVEKRAFPKGLSATMSITWSSSSHMDSLLPCERELRWKWCWGWFWWRMRLDGDGDNVVIVDVEKVIILHMQSSKHKEGLVERRDWKLKGDEFLSSPKNYGKGEGKGSAQGDLVLLLISFISWSSSRPLQHSLLPLGLVSTFFPFSFLVRKRH